MTATQPLLSADERRAPRAMVERALLLVGRIHRGDARVAAAAQAELARWRATSPLHAEAAATAQLVWNATSADGLRERLPLPASAAQLDRRRRRVGGALGVAGLALLSGLGAHWYARQPLLELALQTERAQTLSRTLPDGSTVDLAARTAMHLAYYRDRRSVRLTKGEARFEVVADAGRPFTVDTPWGRVRVLGTVFSVAARDNHMRVAVAHGRVEVWPSSTDPRDGGGAPITLQAGQSVLAGARGLGTPVAVDPGDVGAWRQGWLVFRNTPLPEAVARWNDYLAQPLQLGDAAVLLPLRVTGSYPLRHPQAFLDSLTTMLPVRVERTADANVRIAPRR